MTSSPDVAAPLRSIGIVGGGQLAWMLAEAAAELGVALHVQTPCSTDPAASRATSVVEASLEDVEATRRLAERCGAVSFENEWIPLADLAPLVEEGVCFLPSLQALAPLVDKRAQRRLLDALHLPTLRWCPLEAALPAASVVPPRSWEPLEPEGLAAVQPQVLSSPFQAGGEEPGLAADPRTGRPLTPPAPRLPDGFVFPLIAKAARGGYDGQGIRLLSDQADLGALLAEVEPSEWLLEELVSFEQELAVVACRDRQGTVLVYPLVETHQHQQVCDWVLFPAPVDHGVDAFARNVAASLLTALDYVGVLAIEFFYGPRGLQINELAPRTHNSGHYTIEACHTSQFAQQVRIITGLPMGSTEARLPAALMINLLAGPQALDPEDEAERLQRLRQIPQAGLHWYGKRGHRSGRKLGHLTIALQGATAHERQVECERWLALVRSLWPLPEPRSGGSSA